MLRNVLIKPVLNGWIVEVGCQQVVFDNKERMLKSISSYLDDPKETERYWRTHAVNAKHTFRDAEAIAHYDPGTVESIHLNIISDE